jgi:hypothetical protein
MADFANGLAITASGDALSARVAELMNDGGTYVCWLEASVTGEGRAKLDGPSSCPVEAPDLIGVQYEEGNFTLDGGDLTADLEVGFPLPGTAADGGAIHSGTGAQVSTCERLQSPVCPWD